MADVIIQSVEAEVTEIKAEYDSSKDDVTVSVCWGDESDWHDIQLRLPPRSVNVRDKIVIEIRRASEK
jgi:hypothetical protein